MRTVPASDRSLLVYTEDVAWLLAAFEASPLRVVVNLHPAYESILIVFDPLATTHDQVRTWISDVEHRARPQPLAPAPTIEIPVRYGGEDGPDLAGVAAMHALTPEQAIEAHASAIYTVAFLGFLPGFAYLTGLPDVLATPRLEVPRPLVPAGSVGIAGWQAGVYPCATPGGWRLIGRTSLAMLRPDATGIALLRSGDKVRFVPCR